MNRKARRMTTQFIEPHKKEGNVKVDITEDILHDIKMFIKRIELQHVSTANRYFLDLMQSAMHTRNPHLVDDLWIGKTYSDLRIKFRAHQREEEMLISINKLIDKEQNLWRTIHMALVPPSQNIIGFKNIKFNLMVVGEVFESAKVFLKCIKHMLAGHKFAIVKCSGSRKHWLPDILKLFDYPFSCVALNWGSCFAMSYQAVRYCNKVEILPYGEFAVEMKDLIKDLESIGGWLMRRELNGLPKYLVIKAGHLNAEFTIELLLPFLTNEFLVAVLPINFFVVIVSEGMIPVSFTYENELTNETLVFGRANQFDETVEGDLAHGYLLRRSLRAGPHEEISADTFSGAQENKVELIW